MAAEVATKILAPTVEQINADRITEVVFYFTYLKPRNKSFLLALQLADKYWAPHSTQKQLKFDPAVVEDIYLQDIRGSK